MQPVQLDGESTWPPSLLALLSDALPALRAFEAERERIDAECEEDVGKRIAPPSNSQALARSTLLSEIDAVLKECNVVGWHCTRLTEAEIQRVERAEGLLPLSSVLLNGRIDKIVASGEISASLAIKLKESHLAGAANRSGMIWLIFSPDTLSDEHGLFRLFRSWGGESLYMHHERDPESGPALRRIGLPCIVEAIVPASEIHSHCSLGERSLRAYLHRREIRTGHDPQMEGYVRVPVQQIRRVIRHSDADFGRLTNSERWSRPVL